MRTKRTILAVLVAVVMILAVAADANAAEVTASWFPPATGDVPEGYITRIYESGSPIPSIVDTLGNVNSHAVELPAGSWDFEVCAYWSADLEAPDGSWVPIGDRLLGPYGTRSLLCRIPETGGAPTSAIWVSVIVEVRVAGPQPPTAVHVVEAPE